MGRSHTFRVKNKIDHPRKYFLPVKTTNSNNKQLNYNKLCHWLEQNSICCIATGSKRKHPFKAKKDEKNKRRMSHIDKGEILFELEPSKQREFLSVAKPRPWNGQCCCCCCCCCCCSSSCWRYFCIIGSMEDTEKLIKTKV